MGRRKQNDLQESPIPPEVSLLPRENRPESSLNPLLLTPSEIESLRRQKKQIHRQARGKFSHLFSAVKEK